MTASRFLWVIPVLLLVSCSPKIIENTKTEIVYRDRVQKDTTYLRDSVFIKEVTKGDTIRITEYRDRYHYDYKYLRDTLFVRDSVAVERVKEVKVEKPLSFGQSVKIRAFWWLLGIALALGLWTFRKPLLRLITK